MAITNLHQEAEPPLTHETAADTFVSANAKGAYRKSAPPTLEFDSMPLRISDLLSSDIGRGDRVNDKAYVSSFTPSRTASLVGDHEP